MERRSRNNGKAIRKLRRNAERPSEHSERLERLNKPDDSTNYWY